MNTETKKLARKLLEANGVKGLEALAKEPAMMTWIETSLARIAEAHQNYTYFEKVQMTAETFVKLVETFHSEYMEQDEYTEEFGKEFFYLIGHLLNEEIPTRLEYVDVNELTPMINDILAEQTFTTPEVKRVPIKLDDEQKLQLEDLEAAGVLDIIAERNVLRVQVNAYEKRLKELGEI
ncbi:hypothetical protein_gp063 [Bacillus phage vB_BceM_WH1]|nr:hypothetical protein_gp063 [Bacillus phage vB_BceM_WH1]